MRYNLGGLTDLKFPAATSSLWAYTASCARSSSSTDSFEFTRFRHVLRRASSLKEGAFGRMEHFSFSPEPPSVRKTPPRPGRWHESARRRRGMGGIAQAMTEGVSFICPTRALCRVSIFRLLFVWADSIVVLFSVLVYELVGPTLTKIALTAAGDSSRGTHQRPCGGEQTGRSCIKRLFCRNVTQSLTNAVIFCILSTRDWNNFFLLCHGLAAAGK